MNNDIKTINNAGILTRENIESLRLISQSIEAGFERRQRFRPRFLMETSVLNDMKFPTVDSKYWQSTIERDVHFRNLVELSYDYREKEADIMILEENMNKLCTKGEIVKCEVQIERGRMQLIYMQKEAEERVREIVNWSEIMGKLEPQLKYAAEDVEAHMPEAYALRFAREEEMMGVVKGQSDMNGAMNILSVARTVYQHPKVQQLMEAENERVQINKGN